MAVDESFSEYVSVRWSALYRTAVLLVGGDRARELTEAALARAFASWREVRDVVAADPMVTSILARQAVRSGRYAARGPRGATAVPEPEGGADRDERLWSRVSTLSPRQRAVVVLLYYEGLGEDEIARALGCSAGTVRAEAFAALVQHVDVAVFTTSELRDALVRRADEAVVPLPPVEALLARGAGERRRRSRRPLVWSAGVAAVVLVGTTLASVAGGGGADRPGSASTPSAARSTSAPGIPASLAKVPEGRPADVVYVSGRVLRVDGRRVLLDRRPTALAQTPSHVFVADAAGTVVAVDRRTSAVRTLTDAAAGPMAVSPAGDVVAWPVVRSGLAQVVLDTVTRTGVLPAAERTFPARPRCCTDPFLLAGVTASGQVIGTLPARGRAWAWDPAGSGRVREIAGLDGDVVDRVSGDEVVLRSPPLHYAVGVLRDGVFRALGRYRARSVDFGDPLGRRIVYVDDTGAAYVGERRPRRGRGGGNEVRLALPALDAGFARARWEDSGHVLLDVSDDVVPYGALVRCDVVSGACEIAVRFDGPHLVAP